MSELRFRSLPGDPSGCDVGRQARCRQSGPQEGLEEVQWQLSSTVEYGLVWFAYFAKTLVLRSTEDLLGMYSTRLAQTRVF